VAIKSMISLWGKTSLRIESSFSAERRMDPSAVPVAPWEAEQFIEFGLITPMKRERAKAFFDPSVVSRLQTIARLREGLGITLRAFQSFWIWLTGCPLFTREQSTPKQALNRACTGHQ
jgi:hypothetical protein